MCRDQCHPQRNVLLSQHDGRWGVGGWNSGLFWLKWLENTLSRNLKILDNRVPIYVVRVEKNYAGHVCLFPILFLVSPYYHGGRRQWT